MYILVYFTTRKSIRGILRICRRLPQAKHNPVQFTDNLTVRNKSHYIRAWKASGLRRRWPVTLITGGNGGVGGCDVWWRCSYTAVYWPVMCIWRSGRTTILQYCTARLTRNDELTRNMENVDRGKYSVLYYINIQCVSRGFDDFALTVYYIIFYTEIILCKIFSIQNLLVI